MKRFNVNLAVEDLLEAANLAVHGTRASTCCSTGSDPGRIPLPAATDEPSTPTASDRTCCAQAAGACRPPGAD